MGEGHGYISCRENPALTSSNELRSVLMWLVEEGFIPDRQLWIVSHARTVWDPERSATGTLNVELLELRPREYPVSFQLTRSSLRCHSVSEAYMTLSNDVEFLSTSLASYT